MAGFHPVCVKLVTDECKAVTVGVSGCRAIPRCLPASISVLPVTDGLPEMS